MRPADVEAVTSLARRAHVDASPVTDAPDALPGLSSWTEHPDLNSADARVSATEVVQHVLRTDPGDCFVVQTGGVVTAAAMAVSREGLLALALLAVAPHTLDPDAGRMLTRRVGSLVDASPRCMAVVTDPASIATLFGWGFDVHPAIRAEGVVDRSGLPRIQSVRDGTPEDRELCEAIDRRMRGASRGPDHDLFSSAGRLFIAESRGGQGYAYARVNGSPITVAATHTALARELLVACLASGPVGTTARVGNLTSEQRWAFDVIRNVDLSLRIAGPVMVRGMGLPAPYLPHEVLG